MEKPVRIKIDEVTLEGALGLPQRAKGVVIFGHGSGSSRLSPRNTYVARVLQQAGIGTLLFDLLTSEEDRVYERRFDIDLLARRLVGATRWLTARPDLAIPCLEKVLAPTLLIVGERDTKVLQLNRQALSHLTVEKESAVVPGATHLFEEPCALEQVASLAKSWFVRFLC